MRSLLHDRQVLITGGTGSMGKVLVRRILSGEAGTPRKVIVLSRDEAKQHGMRIEFMNARAATDEVIYNNFHRLLEFRIGDVRDYGDVLSAMRDCHVVINAAALKQVPTCEYFPDQALMTNCLGPNNLVRAIVEQNLPVEVVVGISTDKAAKPVNAMGMTKALQERIFISGNIRKPSTRFICVRYGNVMASRGSVIPLFRQQISSGGPVTLTVPHMTRFLLSINDAVDTVFSALAVAQAGEILVPNAVSATVENIARALIGHRPVETKITGIRPGEKLHEIMISEEEVPYVRSRGNYYGITSMLPELQNESGSQDASPLSKEFSSADNVIDLAQTIELLRRHELLMDSAVDPDVELVR